MLTYHVEDMSCGHCVGSITHAVQDLDPQARVAVDLAQRRLTVASALADDSAVRAALAEAGYTAVPVAPEAGPPARSPRAGGCGCHSGGSRCGGR